MRTFREKVVRAWEKYGHPLTEKEKASGFIDELVAAIRCKSDWGAVRLLKRKGWTQPDVMAAEYRRLFKVPVGKRTVRGFAPSVRYCPRCGQRVDRW